MVNQNLLQQLIRWRADVGLKLLYRLIYPHQVKLLVWFLMQDIMSLEACSNWALNGLLQQGAALPTT